MKLVDGQNPVRKCEHLQTEKILLASLILVCITISWMKNLTWKLAVKTHQGYNTQSRTYTIHKQVCRYEHACTQAHHYACVHTHTHNCRYHLIESLALLLLLFGVQESSYENASADENYTHHQQHHLLPCAQWGGFRVFYVVWQKWETRLLF